MPGRYALYFVPDASSPLYVLGSRLLGRCLYTGKDLERPVLPGLDPKSLADYCRRPAHYGFHATIVAPFECLLPLEDLKTLLGEMTKSLAPFPLPPMRVSLMEGGFAALVPDSPSLPLSALEEKCLMALDPYRCPLAPEEAERRGTLSEKERYYLGRYGYHLVLDRFAFHMTLSGPLPPSPEREGFLGALERYISPAAECGYWFDSLALCRQVAREEPFVCRHVARFGS